MLNEIISAFILGLIGGIIPGPVLTAIFTQILQSGILKSFRIILWAMLIETIVALFSLIAISSFDLPLSYFNVISVVGAFILIWIATSIWKIKKIDNQQKANIGIGKITLLILSNGMLWTFWITVCIPKAILLNEKISFGSYMFLILVEVGWLMSTIVVAFLFSRFRHTLSNPKLVPIVFKVFAFAFIYFATDMIYRSIKYFMLLGMD